MLEGPLKALISGFLGDYVESQNATISTNLWTSSQRLQLENLTLRKTIIPSFLPFRLKVGFIGKFEVDLPISAIFGNAAARIRISDVLIVLAPLEHTEEEQNKEITRLVDEKLQQLEQDLFDRWYGPRGSEYTVPHESEGYFGTDGWVGRTLTKLIDNLQIDIRNFHLRIEGHWSPSDNETLSSKKGSPGNRHLITPKDCDIHSTNSQVSNASNSTSESSYHPDTTKYAVGVSLGALSMVTTNNVWHVQGLVSTQIDENEMDDNKDTELSNTNTSIPNEPRSKRGVSFHSQPPSSTYQRKRNLSTISATGSQSTLPNHLVFKLFTAIELSAYVDPHARHFIHSRVHPRVLQSTLSRLQDMGRSGSAKPNWWTVDDSVYVHRFVIAPIDVSLKLIANTATQHAATGDPRYNAAFDMSKVVIALDEEQIAIINLIVELYFKHTEWQSKLNDQLKAREVATASDTIEMNTIAQEYSNLWREVMSKNHSREEFEKLKKHELWTKITAMEAFLPLKAVVDMRNRSSPPLALSKTTLPSDENRNSFNDILYELSSIFGNPLPEISVVFPGGITGLVLERKDPSNDVIVIGCTEATPAGRKSAVRPGLILIEVDGMPVTHLFPNFGGTDIQNAIDSQKESKLLTFRHPLARAPEVTPETMVSKVSIQTKTLSFQLVYAMKRKPLLNAVFLNTSVQICGYGPILFWYHQYSVDISDFYVQYVAYNSFESSHINHCLASSVSNRTDTNNDERYIWDDYDNRQLFPASISIALDYLDESHPSAIAGNVSTYGTRFSFAFGDCIAVFDGYKMTILVQELTSIFDAMNKHSYRNSKAILINNNACPQVDFTQINSMANPKSHGGVHNTRESLMSSNLTQNSSLHSAFDVPELPSNMPTKPPDDPLPSRYSYNINIDLVRIFVRRQDSLQEGNINNQDQNNQNNQNPSNGTANPMTHTYGTLIKKLVRKDSSNISAATTMKEWRLATQLVIAIQRFRRGALVRRQRQGDLNPRHSDVSEDDCTYIEGWMFIRNDTLAFRRWDRWWCRLQNSVFSVHENGWTDEALESFDIAHCRITQIMESYGGPQGTLERCNQIEISFNNGLVRAVLCPTIADQFHNWLTALNLASRAYTHSSNEAINPQFVERDEFFGSPQITLLTTDDIILGGFIDVYSKRSTLARQKSQWVSLVVADLVLSSDIHTGYDKSTGDHDGHTVSRLYVGVNYVELKNHGEERRAGGGILHIGDKYLTLKNSKLVPTIVRLDRFDPISGQRGYILPFFALRLSYRGEQVALNELLWEPTPIIASEEQIDWLAPHDEKNGLRVDLELSGWVMPLQLVTLIYEITNIFQCLWLGTSSKTTVNISNDESPTPWLQVSDLELFVRSPLLELYVQDADYIAKLSFEKSTIKYSADPFREEMEFNFGPLALYVLTDEIVLRLIQISYLRCWYHLQVPNLHAKPYGHHYPKLAEGCDICSKNEAFNKRKFHRRLNVDFGIVKMEADDRLALLFGLLEAMTSSNINANGSDLLNPPSITVRDIQHTNNLPTEFISAVGGRSPPERNMDNVRARQYGRMVSMPVINIGEVESGSWQHNASSFHAYASVPRRHRRNCSSGTMNSRGSNGFTGVNMQPESYLNRQFRPAQPISLSWGPLLSYQSFITIIVSPITIIHNKPIDSFKTFDSKRKRIKTLWQRVLSGRDMHDRMKFMCTSIEFEVIKRSLALLALDTCIPVINFSMNDIHLQIITQSEFALEYLIEANVELMAQYYNSALADWEPFIEPWRAYGKVRNDNNDSLENVDSKGTFIEFSALHRLNVNITDSLIRLLAHVIKSRRNSSVQQPIAQLNAIKNSGNTHIIQQRTAAAVAADSEAKKEDGRVCVLNNLGVPIKLADLNTSHAGRLRVELRDGWSLPSYARLHNIRVEVVLLPWWHPREVVSLQNLRHSFSLRYSGAQSGVTPILRVNVLSKMEGRTNYVFDQITNKFVNADDHDHHMLADISYTSNGNKLTSQSAKHASEKWTSIGMTDVNLAHDVMSSLDEYGKKVSRWYRLYDDRSHVTGEVLLDLQFVPQENHSSNRSQEREYVHDGQFLVFDPLKTASHGRGQSKTASLEGNGQLEQEVDNPHSINQVAIKLSESLRGSYIPPLALEMKIGSRTCNLLCPLRRAGKFFIEGDNILVQVKVAQRDETRRVLMLSSPLQLKNETELGMEMWTMHTASQPGHNLDVHSCNRAHTMKRLNILPKYKTSIPLDAMHDEEGHGTQSVILHLEGCKPKVIAVIEDLSAQSSIVTFEEEDSDQIKFCLYMKVVAQIRKVYREGQLAAVARSMSTAINSGHETMSSSAPSNYRDAKNTTLESQSYATKFQIRLHSCLVFENTLPVCLDYETFCPSGLYEDHEVTLQSGTLEPGEVVHFTRFEKSAKLKLRLPALDTIWTRPINLADCIYRKDLGLLMASVQHRQNYIEQRRRASTLASTSLLKEVLGAQPTKDPVVQFLPSPNHTVRYSPQSDIEPDNRIITRLDFTNADDGSPRVVIYSSHWIYNHSHIPIILVRSNGGGSNPKSFEVDNKSDKSQSWQSNIITAPILNNAEGTDGRVPKLLDCPDKTLELSALVETDPLWSSKIPTSVMGVQDSVSLKYPPESRGLFNFSQIPTKEVAIAMHRPLGQFHRTTQVVITPRFVVTNATYENFCLSQRTKKISKHNKQFHSGDVIEYSESGEDEIDIPGMSEDSCEPTTTAADFKFSSNRTKQHRNVYIRMHHAGAEWSGPFGLDDEGEFPLVLNGYVSQRWAHTSPDTEINRIRIRVHTVGGTTVLRLMKDEPPMYVIRNESSVELYISQPVSRKTSRQSKSKAKNPHMVVISQHSVPFAWVKQPEKAREVRCAAGIRGRVYGRARTYAFTNLDKDKGHERLTLRIPQEGQRKLEAEIRIEKTSCVLVFRNVINDRPPSYILEVKVISTRLRNDLELESGSTCDMLVSTDIQESIAVPSQELRTAHVYRFDADVEFSSVARPKRLILAFHRSYDIDSDEELSEDETLSPNARNSPLLHDSILVSDLEESALANESEHFSLTLGRQAERTTEDISPRFNYSGLETPPSRSIVASNRSQMPLLRGCQNNSLNFHVNDLEDDRQDRVLQGDEANVHSYAETTLRRNTAAQTANLASPFVNQTNVDKLRRAQLYNAFGTAEIRIPKKAWTHFGVEKYSTKRSVVWSHSSTDRSYKALGRVEGYWWELRSPKDGTLIGEVQVALKFRKSVREQHERHEQSIFYFNLNIPSIGVAFLHTTNSRSSYVEVAYASCQRLECLYTQEGQSSEASFSIGNLQMDNQMDQEVILGPKVYHTKQGVSVRLRDRVASCWNYRYRGMMEAIASNGLLNSNAIEFRMLWNDNCAAGEIVHYELIQFMMEEMEVSTDEKFVAHLIGVFQGLGKLSRRHTSAGYFQELVNMEQNYGQKSFNDNDESLDVNRTRTYDAIYIEDFDIDAIRVKFSLELDGGRHIQTLGPEGKRLAAYLPVSNVKDFRLYLPKSSFKHLYESKDSVLEKVIHRYQRQTMLVVLRGLHTVSVYANPFRIGYRVGHGFVQLVRLPARGLASGSPIELVTGLYLGVRSLVMNLISASYEIAAGAAGFLAVIISPVLPESTGRRKKFQDEMQLFQKAVIEEVEEFDEAEERTMAKKIVRKPRVFANDRGDGTYKSSRQTHDGSRVGLLTIYGPGSRPMEEQDQIDRHAVILLQKWWRRQLYIRQLLAFADIERERIRLLNESDYDGRDEGRARRLRNHLQDATGNGTICILM